MHTETKEVVTSEKFWDILYNSELEVFEVYWKDAHEDIEEELFKQYLFNFLEISKKYQAKGFITDTRAYHYVMPPELQAWHDAFIIPRYIELGFEKIVFILSQDNFIASLSVEQTFEEEKAQAQDFTVHFTDNLEEALAHFVG